MLRSFFRRLPSGLVRLLIVFIPVLVGFMACTATEDEPRHIIDLALDTTNLGDPGQYSRIQIDFLLPDTATPFKKLAFVGKVPARADKVRFDLGQKPPKAYVINLTGYKDDTVAIQMRLKVPRNKDEGWVVIRREGTGSPPREVRILAANPMSLARTGSSVTLRAEVLPDTADPRITWSSSNPKVVSINADGVAKPESVGTAQIIARSAADSRVSDTLDIRVILATQVDSILVAPRTMTVYIGGERPAVSPSVKPSGLSTGFEFSSSDTLIARVSAEGRVQGVSEGWADIMVNPLGFPTVRDTCRVTVVRDVPSLDVGSSRRVAVDEESTFPIKVTQKHGRVAALMWDLDGDQVFEDTVQDSVAAPKWRYGVAGREITALFKVMDTEGNSMTATVRIAVGKGTPLVDITNPSVRDTLVNTPSLKVEYSVDGTTKTQTVSLSKEGPNPVVISETNSEGTGSDTVFVTLDTQPPSAPSFTSATTQSPTLLSQPTWAWTGNGGGNGSYWFVFNGQAEVQTTQKSYTAPALTDGSYTLSVRELDAAGNISPAATRTIAVVLPGPSAPVVTGTSGITRTPQWTWTRASANSTFRIRLFKAGTIAALDSAENTMSTYIPDPSMLTGSNGVDFTLKVSEKDGGKWGEEGSATIKVDVVPPSAPVPTAPAFSQGPPTFTWHSVEGGARYAYRLVRAENGAAIASGIANTLSYTPTLTLEDGVRYRLYLSSQDGAGNISEEAQAVSVADLSPPSLAFTSPSIQGAIGIHNPTFTGTAHDASGITSLRYAIEGGTSGSILVSSNWALSGIPFPLGTRKLTVMAMDSSGRSSSIDFLVTKVEKVFFVRKEGNGTDGSSWENAFKDLNSAVKAAASGGGIPQIWVADGTYTGSGEGNGFEIAYDIKIYGGFDSKGNGRSLSDRKVQLSTERNTILLNSAMSQIGRNVTLDGFSMQGCFLSIIGTGVEISNSSLTGYNGTSYITLLPGSKTNFFNMEIAGNEGGQNGMVWVWNAEAEFIQSDIHHNQCIYHEGPVVLVGETAKVTLNNSRLHDNKGVNHSDFQIGFAHSGGGTIALDAASRINLQGGVCGIGRRENGNVTDLAGNPLSCP